MKNVRYSLQCLVITAICGWLVGLAQPVWAVCDQYACQIETQAEEEYLACNANKQRCLEDKIKETQGQAETLSNAIAILNDQIQIQQLQINQTQAEISQLETEITELSTRIGGLELSLDKLTDSLVERVADNYKQQQLNPLLLLASTDSLSKFISQYKYRQLAQQHLGELMQQAEAQRLTYGEQKSLKEVKQDEVVAKRSQLQSQQNQLAAQEREQKRLLDVTHNDEQRYQQLLAEAKAEVASFKSFSGSKSGGTLDPITSPDGWYFSQRDSRWAGMSIGSSSESMMEVGCLVSATAMVKKKFGEDASPATIGANSSYFFASTAYMLKPWPAPNGWHWVDVGYSQSRLDAELEKNPVILKLSAGPYGTHFIVMKEKKDGNYVMHDPWEGFDKNFQDFYSLGQIVRISYLSR